MGAAVIVPLALTGLLPPRVVHVMFSALFSPLRSRRCPRAAARRSRPRAAAVGELLEPRRLLTVYTVNSLADGAPAADGRLTLREALLAADRNVTVGDAPAGTNRDLIRFDTPLLGRQMQLTAGELTLRSDAGLLVVQGGGVGIEAGGRSRHFNISGRAPVRLVDLRLSDGSAVASAGGRGGGSIVHRDGVLVLDSVALDDNVASSGGALDTLNGRLALVNSEFTDNVANGGQSGGIVGGAIRATGSALQIRGSSISRNTIVATAGSSGLALGGGLQATDSRVAVLNSTISNNEFVVENPGGRQPQAVVAATELLTAGGGVSIASSKLVVRGGWIGENTAGIGGGIDSLFADTIAGGAIRSTMIVTGDTTFFRNTARAGGGAIATTGAALLSGVGFVENASGEGILLGRSRIAGGGALLNYGFVVARNAFFNNNTAARVLPLDGVGNLRELRGGGAIVNRGTLQLFDSSLSANRLQTAHTGDDGFAGGAALMSTGIALVERTQFLQNESLVTGGAIWTASIDGTPTSARDRQMQLRDVTVSRNRAATDGGGIYGSTLVLSRTTVDSNTAGNRGGGLFVSDDGGGVTLGDGAIVRDNVAATGGGAFVARGATLRVDGGRLTGNTPDDVFRA